MLVFKGKQATGCKILFPAPNTILGEREMDLRQGLSNLSCPPPPLPDTPCEGAERADLLAQRKISSPGAPTHSPRPVPTFSNSPRHFPVGPFRATNVSGRGGGAAGKAVRGGARGGSRQAREGERNSTLSTTCTKRRDPPVASERKACPHGRLESPECSNSFTYICLASSPTSTPRDADPTGAFLTGCTSPATKRNNSVSQFLLAPKNG